MPCCTLPQRASLQGSTQHSTQRCPRWLGLRHIGRKTSARARGKLTGGRRARRAHAAASAGAAAMASALKEMIGKQISVITCDGRNIVGTLRGYDQVTNVILEECHERVYSLDAGVEQVVLGLYIIRGDNIAIIGEIDPERDAKTDLSKVRAEAMKPVSHS